MENKKSIKEKIRIISLIFTIAVMGVIFFFSSQPGTESDNVSISLTSLLFSADLGLILNSLVRKIAHMLEYMALGAPLYIFFFTIKGRKSSTAVISIAISVLYAVSDELHQLFVPGRACGIRDMLIDSLGAALCITVLHLLSKNFEKYVSKIKSKKSQ